MSVYKVKTFGRFARRHRVGDQALVVAAQRVRTGQFDADLGGGLYKQRVARNGGGKSGGFRTLLSYRAGGHVFFLYGFAKNQRANIDDDEETTLKRMGKALGAYTQQALDFAVANGDLEEVSDGAEENDESGA
jgi:hypothetical protein